MFSMAIRTSSSPQDALPTISLRGPPINHSDFSWSNSISCPPTQHIRNGLPLARPLGIATWSINARGNLQEYGAKMRKLSAPISRCNRFRHHPILLEEDFALLLCTSFHVGAIAESPAKISRQSKLSCLVAWLLESATPTIRSRRLPGMPRRLPRHSARNLLPQQ